MNSSISNDNIVNLLRHAKTLQQQGLMQQAHEQYQRILVIDPNNFPALFSLGALFGQAGRLEDALGYFTKAYAAAPNDYSAHFNRGLALE